jgi:protein TonB
MPVYPEAARKAKVLGKVIVEVSIDENGNVISARGIQGPTMLYDAAVEAVKQWKFYPARQQGKPVRDVENVVFNFA